MYCSTYSQRNFKGYLSTNCFEREKNLNYLLIDDRRLITSLLFHGRITKLHSSKTFGLPLGYLKFFSEQRHQSLYKVYFSLPSNFNGISISKVYVSLYGLYTIIIQRGIKVCIPKHFFFSIINYCYKWNLTSLIFLQLFFYKSWVD